MQLADWLKQTKTSQAALAARIGVTQGRISQIVRDGTDSLSTALAIETATEQAVGVRDVMMLREQTELNL